MFSSGGSAEENQRGGVVQSAGMPSGLWAAAPNLGVGVDRAADGFEVIKCDLGQRAFSS